MKREQKTRHNVEAASSYPNLGYAQWQDHCLQWTEPHSHKWDYNLIKIEKSKLPASWKLQFKLSESLIKFMCVQYWFLFNDLKIYSCFTWISLHCFKMHNYMCDDCWYQRGDLHIVFRFLWQDISCCRRMGRDGIMF